MEKLMILDGNSLAHRAFHALPLLSTTTGHYTNAVLGFTNMLQKIVRQERPDYVAVAFDKGKTFRHDDYEAYKAHRKATPEELRPQFPLIKRVLGAFNIPALEMAGYEADDLIGTVTRLASERGLEVLVVTGDRDMLQLVSKQVRALITRKGISELDCYAEENVIERYGLKPEQIPDLKGLTGDTSDNIPGVPGIGEKTAVKLLQQYGSVEGCLANRRLLSGKVAALLEQYANQAILSKKLALLVLDVPCDLNFEELRLKKPNYGDLFRVLQELEFKNLLNSMRRELSTDDIIKAAIDHEPERTFCQADGLLSLIAEIKAAGRFAFYSGAAQQDTNTPIRGIGLAWGDNESVALIIPEDYAQKNALFNCLKELLSDPSGEKWCHDAKAEMAAWARYGVTLDGITGDTKLASYLLHSATNPTIEEISMKHLNQVLVLAKDDEAAVAQLALAVYRAWPLLRAELQDEGLRTCFTVWNCLCLQCLSGWSWPGSSWMSPSLMLCLRSSGASWGR